MKFYLEACVAYWLTIWAVRESEKHLKRKEKSPPADNFTHIWRDMTPKLALMNFGTLGDLVDVMNCAIFGFDPFGSFVRPGVENGFFLSSMSTVHNTV
jgi:hypothetical protein